MKRNKKIISLLMAAVILSAYAASAASSVDVVVDGTAIAFTESSPFIDENDRTQIPVRAVSEALGYDVDWDEATQTVTVSNEANLCTFIIGSNNITVQAEIDYSSYGGVIVMDTVPIIVDDYTYVPLRYMCEALNKNVEWDAETSTVIISDSDREMPEVVEEAYNSYTADSAVQMHSPDEAEQITDIYSEEDIPEEWEEYLQRRAEKVYDVEDLADEIVDMQDNVYEIRVSSVGGKNELHFGNELKNLSSKALVEFIPDEYTDEESTFRIEIWKGKTNSEGEYYYNPAMQAQRVPTGKRSAFMIENIEDVQYSIDFNCFESSTKAFSGTVKIVNFD